MSSDDKQTACTSESTSANEILIKADDTSSTPVSPRLAKTKSKSCGNSPKCSRENSRQHSPLLVSRKSSKHNSFVELEGGEEAPFGRDSANSPYASPFSERATPPYLRWAKSLDDVLDDYEGMELFKQFLCDDHHALDFWYACIGLKKLDDKDQDRVQKVAERLNADYVRLRGAYCLSYLSPETRTEISRRIVQRRVDRDMFEEARRETKLYLRTKHAEFVRSDAYILYLQDIQSGGWDSPKCYSHETQSNNSSSSGDAHRPSSSLLPTVHEDVEFECDAGTLRTSEAEELGAALIKSTEECITIEADAASWADRTLTSSRNATHNESDVSNVSTLVNVVEETPPPATTSTKCVDDALPNTAVASGGLKRRAASNGAQQQQARYVVSTLTRDLLAATAGQRLTASKNIGSRNRVMHPYHAAYVPYLPTSAQDSELQSMSSDATTESGFSGANYYRKETRIMQHHVERNRDSQMTIPRTQHPSQTQHQDTEKLLRSACDKLEKLRSSIERNEKLGETIKRLAEPENSCNNHRAAVNKFYKEEKSNRQSSDDAEAILEDYFARVEFLKDSPKHSPLRSPAFTASGRRRSPIAKSPNRAMITSYPLAGQAPITALQHSNAKIIGDPAAAMMSQSVIHPSRSKSGHHSAGNTIQRVPKHEPFAAVSATAPPPVEKRSSGAVAKKPPTRYQPASDTSGISSGTSTEPSVVSARMTPNVTISRTNEQWIGEKQSCEAEFSDASRHKQRSGGSVGASGEQKSHRGSYPKSSGDRCSLPDKTRTQKMPADMSSSQTHRNPALSRRSEGSGMQVASGGDIMVGIFLPNEPVPYMTRYRGQFLTLKQFKQLLPRKGNFRYFFQCPSNDLGTQTVRQEVVDDQEFVPLLNNKVVAQIELVE